MKTEIWKDVVGYEGLYSVSDQGRVKGLKRNKNLRLLDKGRGYRHVLLYKNRKSKNASVHSLVLEAFRGQRPLSFDGSHIDGNKTNNNISNLCWESKLDNNNRKIGHGTNNSGTDNVTSKLTEGEVIQIRKIYSWGCRTQTELGIRFRISQSNISDIVTRKIWSHI